MPRGYKRITKNGSILWGGFMIETKSCCVPLDDYLFLCTQTGIMFFSSDIVNWCNNCLPDMETEEVNESNES